MDALGLELWLGKDGFVVGKQVVPAQGGYVAVGYAIVLGRAFDHNWRQTVPLPPLLELLVLQICTRRDQPNILDRTGKNKNN
jgi:hypothetical protein